MPEPRPEASSEPTRILRIARACTTPGCGAVFYVASVIGHATCPKCAAGRDAYELSA